MKKQKETITAEALLARMNSDPQQRARMAAQEREAAEHRKLLAAAEKPVIDDLRALGVNATSVWSLTAEQRAIAVPVLLQHLSVPYPDRIREGIAGALAVREAHVGWSTLLKAFRDDPGVASMGRKWALALALGAAATDADLHDVFELLADSKLGRNRVPLLDVLTRSRDPRALAKLEQLAEEEGIASDVKKLLKKTRMGRGQAGVSASPAEPFVNRKPGLESLVEASLALDADKLAPFLNELSKLVSGFGPTEIRKVVDASEGLDVDAECELRFEVAWRGTRVPLEIHIFMDDTDSPDLYVWTVPSLGTEIQDMMDDFGED